MEEYSDRMPTDIARFPMVPIRDVVIFPFTKVAFKIGRPGSVRALEAAEDMARVFMGLGDLGTKELGSSAVLSPSVP